MRLRRLFWAAAIAPALAGPVAAEPLPEPLDLSSALQAAPQDLARQKLAADYQETAIRARAFECRAQDGAGRASANTLVECGYWHLLTPEQQTRLDVIRRFLDVTEADLAAARDEEAMAVAYVELDRARNRQALGQRSDLDVAEADAHYQSIRRGRFASVAAQRLTRERLANALGRPGELASELVPPSIPQGFPDLEEFDVLLQRAERENRVLHQWRQLAMEDPQAQYIVRQLLLDLREAILELLLDYSVHKTELDEADTNQFFSDLRLEENRTLYELEAKADLGEAMADQTAARLRTMQVKHRLLLLMATLDALAGQVPMMAEEGQ